MPAETMQDLFVEEIKDLYSAENQILKALPRIIKAVQSTELEQALTEHLHVTEKHVTRLEQIAAQLGKRPGGKKCVGMEGVLKEGKEALQEMEESEVRDAAIIGGAQRVEHYEIAGYGTARAHALQLGEQDFAALLEQTLEEEKEADKTLTELAESSINEMAVEEGSDGNMKNSTPTSRIPRGELRTDYDTRAQRAADAGDEDEENFDQEEPEQTDMEAEMGIRGR